MSHKARKAGVFKKNLNKKIAEKVRKLVSSPFGQYLVRELRRAGSIQVLTGHTSSSLKELSELRRKCNADGGFAEGKALGAYELSHVYPVQHSEFIGLLHPKNLVISSKEFNRRHSNKVPVFSGVGLTIPRTDLTEKWRVTDQQTALSVLQAARKFLGSEFDSWLKGHSVATDQKTKLLKKLKKTGLDPKSLKNKTFSELRSINNAIEENGEVSHWTLSNDAKERFSTALQELTRLGIVGEIEKALSILEQEYWSLEEGAWVFKGTDYQEYVDALIEQAELLLHGQPYEKTWHGVNFSKWWIPNSVREALPDDPSDDYIF